MLCCSVLYGRVGRLHFLCPLASIWADRSPQQTLPIHVPDEISPNEDSEVAWPNIIANNLLTHSVFSITASSLGLLETPQSHARQSVLVCISLSSFLIPIQLSYSPATTNNPEVNLIDPCYYIEYLWLFHIFEVFTQNL